MIRQTAASRFGQVVGLWYLLGHGIDLRAIMPHYASFGSSSVTVAQNSTVTLIPHALVVPKIVRNDLPNHGQLVWTGCGLMVLVRPRN